jgi:hypothetical protein
LKIFVMNEHWGLPAVEVLQIAAGYPGVRVPNLNESIRFHAQLLE